MRLDSDLSHSNMGLPESSLIASRAVYETFWTTIVECYIMDLATVSEGIWTYSETILMRWHMQYQKLDTTFSTWSPLHFLPLAYQTVAWTLFLSLESRYSKTSTTSPFVARYIPQSHHSTEGKTSLTRFMVLRNKNIIDVATSAAAAQLLFGRRDANFIFKVSISCNECRTCKVRAKSQSAIDLKNIYMIIWDVVVMCPCYCIDAVDFKIRDIARKHLLFVVESYCSPDTFDKSFLSWRGSHAWTVLACVKTSPLYKQSRNFRLFENI